MSAGCGRDLGYKEVGKETAEGFRRAEGDADADSRQEAEGGRCEETGGEAATEVGLMKRRRCSRSPS